MPGGVAAVVLAAGAATRFGSAKQLVLLPRVLEQIARSTLDPVVVVEGAYSLSEVVEPPARLVRCPDWEAGPGASLRCGLAAFTAEIEAAIVILADGPRLSPDALERIVASWRREGGDVVAASYAGVRGHPLLVARALWEAIPDEGLRSVRPRLVPCDDLGPPGDVDRPEDLRALDGG